MKTVDELRIDFEIMAEGCMFDIDRLPNGEYKDCGRNTFTLWAGYWDCAKANGVINPKSNNLKMNDY